MTAHPRDSIGLAAHTRNTEPPGRPASTLSRPWWLWPAVAAALVAGGLVLAGILSLSAVLYAGLFGGMLLMHTGGHGGHGSHGGDARQANSHGGHSSGTDDPADDRTAVDAETTGERRSDKHTSHGCH